MTPRGENKMKYNFIFYLTLLSWENNGDADNLQSISRVSK